MTLKQFYKFKNKFILCAAFCAAVLFCCETAQAQEIEAKIKITSIARSGARVHVNGKFLNSKSNLASRDLSFLQVYADVAELGVRIENLNLFDEKGERLAVKKFIAGEFQTDKAAVSFEYDVKTEAPGQLTAAAHVSWLSDEHGLLMLNDLLPQWKSDQPISAKISIEIPDDWRISSSEIRNSENAFDVRNIEKAIFLVGKNWREKNVRVDKTDLNFVIAGEWKFSDAEAWQLAQSVLKEHRKIFGKIPVPKAQIILLPFPQERNQPERWRAETRGSTVLVLSGAMPFKSLALQRLEEQLRHELFHLWMPNALALSGNYDWFYEGFTIYQALRTAVEMHQIRFQDYLNTLARAYDASQRQNVSLIEISNKRWTGGGNNSLYAKGMIAAFLCDAMLLRESKGKRSLQNIFREIYQKHQTPNPVVNGNEAILGILKSYPELRPVVQNYIEGTAKLEWQEILRAFGIETIEIDSVTKLKVMEKPGGRQKDLLEKLGYNQSLDAVR
jgi:predicted metalloprotease with PDZ domain